MCRIHRRRAYEHKPGNQGRDPAVQVRPPVPQMDGYRPAFPDASKPLGPVRKAVSDELPGIGDK